VLGDLPEDLDLSGQHILLGHRTALDPAGYLLLDVGADPEEWGWFLEGVDLQYAAGRRALAASVKGLEAQCAAALGVSQVFTTAAAVTDHGYRWAGGGPGRVLTAAWLGQCALGGSLLQLLPTSSQVCEGQAASAALISTCAA
jgi:hypothetical protein